MPKIKKYQGEKTSVELLKIGVVREKLVRTGMKMKDYINSLIREDMMRSGEYFSNLYFKGIRGNGGA